jgi:Ca-activated chloride channel homolog
VGAEDRVNRADWFGIEILRPALAVALVGVPLVALVVWYGLARRAKERARLVEARLEPTFLPRFSSAKAIARGILGVAALAFLALALLGPVRGFTLRDVQRKGLDLVVCVDSSRSMLVQDLKPDRLTRAKREVTGLLDQLAGDRVALLAFSGDVREIAPLTHDRETLKTFVNAISTGDNMKGGTDIGAALDKALSIFDGRSGAFEAIVVLTDGEDLEGKGLEVAARAKERNIKVYLVGMGTEGGGKIPDDARFVRDESGKEVVSKLSGESLRAIADLTGGAYLSAESSPVPLQEIYEKRIQKLDRRDLFAGKEKVPHDRYQWPLALALVCMLLEIGLRERTTFDPRARRSRRAERERLRGAA